MSSGWVFWEPATYVIKNVVVNANAVSVKNNEFDFIVENNEHRNFLEAWISKWPKNTSIILNNQVVTEDVVEKTFFEPGRNTLVFEPWPGIVTEEPAELTIWYSEKAML